MRYRHRRQCSVAAKMLSLLKMSITIPVTVVIPTYNRAPLLARALQSVLDQTFKPQEILLVDDGSTDQTEDLLRRNFPSVGYLRQSNRGVSAARNLGIRQGGGEWFAFLDSDDQWLPQKLERQWQALQQSPQMRVCHSDEIWIRNGRRVNPKRKHAKAGGWIFRHCLPLCAMSPSSIVIHRSVFDAVGTFDPQLPACEDYDLWLRICARYPVLLVDQPLLIKYGGHTDQLSRRYWGMDRFRVRALEKILSCGGLSEDDRRAAEATLREKLTILANGARKRGKTQEVLNYQTRLSRLAWQSP